MERRYNLRPRASARIQTGNAAQHHRFQHHVPPAGVPPSSDVHSLRQALLSAEEHNMSLASENAALKEHFASLQETNKNVMKEKSCMQSTLGRKLYMAEQKIMELEKALKVRKADPGTDRESRDELHSLRESLRANAEEKLIFARQLCLKETELNESLIRCNALEEKVREELAERERREKELSSLRDSLSAMKEKTEGVVGFMVKMHDQMKDAELKSVTSMCDTQRSNDLQQMQADCLRKVSQLQETIAEKDNEISTFKAEIKRKETEVKQSIEECNALQVDFQKDLVQREQSWERSQKEMEKLWAEKEEALMKRASEAEEELKLQIVKSIRLQELALKKKEKKKKRGYWSKRSQRNNSDEDASVFLAQASQEAPENEKKEKKESKRGFWGKKNQKSNSDNEASVRQAQAGQDQEIEEKKRSLWSWAHKKRSSERKVEEGAVCLSLDGQQ